MAHHYRPPEQDDLLRPRVVDMIDLRHELVTLTSLIDWEVFEREWAGFFSSPTGAAGHASQTRGGVALSAARLSGVGRGD